MAGGSRRQPSLGGIALFAEKGSQPCSRGAACRGSVPQSKARAPLPGRVRLMASPWPINPHPAHLDDPACMASHELT